MWLGLTALQREDREDLLGALITLDGLFGSLSSVTQHFQWLEEEKMQLSCHLLLRILNQYFARNMFGMLTIRRLLG